VVENQSTPTSIVVPILVYADVEKAIEWLCNAFGFAERLRVEHAGSVNHAQLIARRSSAAGSSGAGDIMLGRQGAEFRPPRGGEVYQFVHVTVDDVDRHFEHAKAAGARILNVPHDLPFGERQYTAEDPEGHRWVFSQHVADVAPQQWGARLA
jgi:uncharacterized glyoxalase superfamily protein PhnB